MTTRAYLITITTSSERKIFLCGLDENDLVMRLRLKSEYEKADVMYISSNATDIVNHYFALTTCKTSVGKKTIQRMTTLSEAVTRSEWPALCLVNISELEELHQKLVDLGTITAVDLDQFDSNFDDDEVYYKRIPHVLTTSVIPSSYAGILNVLAQEAPNNNNPASLAFRSNDHSMDDIEITNAIPFDDSTTENFVLAYRPDELQLVPYVAPVEKEDLEEEEVYPATNCVIM